ILLPALYKVRESSESVACKSNLKQWGLASRIYSNLTNEDLYLLKDGTRALTGDWSYGAARKIQGGHAAFTNSLIIPVEA
ncbi:MAG: hypothetical protein ACXABY_12820, partial [Candidatus Thorarchaeota archaeon]